MTKTVPIIKTDQQVFSDLEAEKIKQIEKAKQLYFLLNEYSFSNSKSMNATIVTMKTSF